MRLPVVLFLLCVCQVSFIDATLSHLYNPLKNLLGWGTSNNQTKSNRFGVDDADPVPRRPTVVGNHQLTPDGKKDLVGPKVVGAGKEAEGHPVLIPEDFNTAASTEPPNASPADPRLRLATSTASSSGHSSSVTSTTDPTTSAGSVSASATEANPSHMVDFKIPGGESPEGETLPDAAVFKPKGDGGNEGSSGAGPANTGGESQISHAGKSVPMTSSSSPMLSAPASTLPTSATPASTAEPSPSTATSTTASTGKTSTTTEEDDDETELPPAPHSDFPTTTATVPPKVAKTTEGPTTTEEPDDETELPGAPEIDFPTKTQDAVPIATPKTESVSKSTTKESARESDRFVQTIHAPPRSYVVQDVNDLFQSEE